MEPLNSGPRHYWLGGKRKPEQDRFFKRALDASVWEAGDAKDWQACWFTGMPKASQFRKAGPERKINHIPGNNSLTVKNRLYDTVSALRERMCEQFGPDHETVLRLGFLPKVYAMPQDYHALQQAALDDPGQRWILKPKNAARGKGVRVIRDVAGVPMEESWMVQEYLPKPHTMRQRKYVLRLYVLVAGVEPLRVYLYRQGFAKLASAPYDVNDIDNLYSQLTNPDINALNTSADVPVEFVDLDRYRQWLRDLGHDDEVLFERIRDLVTLTVVAAVEPLRRRTAEYGADPRGCYELLGVDCLIDEELNPWILECNLSPSLGVCAGPESGGLMEERVKADLVADLVSLVGLNGSASAPAAPDPVERIRREAESEYARAGGFQRLYPNADVERYLPFFSLPRLADIVLADAVRGAPVKRPRLRRRHAVEVMTDDQLALYDERSGRLYRLNETASLIWLLAVEGVDPDGIAGELAVSAANAGAAPDRWAIHNDIWNSLADWAHTGLLIQQGDAGSMPDAIPLRTQISKPAYKPRLDTFPFQAPLTCGAQRLEFHTDSRPVVARLQAVLSSLQAEPGSPASLRLEVVRDTPGYALIFNGEVIASRLTLAAVGPTLCDYLARRAAADGEMVLDAGVVPRLDEKVGSVLFAGAKSAPEDGFALHFANHYGRGFFRGLRFDTRSFDRASVIGLPGRSDGGLTPASRTGLSGSHIVEAVILPRHALAPRENIIQPLSVGEALGELLPACFLASGEPLDAETLLGFADWLSRRPRYSVDISDYETAIEALMHYLETLPVELELTSAT